MNAQSQAATTLLSAVLFATLAQADEDANSAVFVRKGEALSVRQIGKAWTQEGKELVCSGERSFLFAGKKLGPGDFHVRARLSLDQLNDSAASFTIGSNNFGFDGDRPGQHRFFVQGPQFGNTKFLKSTIKAVTPFDFEAVRKDSKLTISIDGKDVWSTDFSTDQFVRFGLRPWRATMRVGEFAATGNLIDLPKLPLINPRLPRGYTIPMIDLSKDKHRQVVVDRQPGQYLGHPTTVLMPDGKTMFCTYPLGHGRPAAVLKKSIDGGLTWSQRLDVPDNWRTANNCPCLHRLTDPQGVERLFVLEGNGAMRQAMSSDKGKSWTPFKPNGLHCTVAPNTAIPISGNRYLVHYAREHGGPRNIKIWQSITADGGLTWEKERIVAEVDGAAPDEPGSIKSPDGRQIVSLLRENQRRCNSLYILSYDEGKIWTVPRELTASLTGDRHMPRYAPDGRLVVSFRDMAHESPTHGDWVAWVGTYQDIIEGREGQYRIRLMDNLVSSDCGYPGMELLPDGTFVATTYGHWVQGEKPFVMSVRFKLNEIDELAKKAAVHGADPVLTGTMPLTIQEPLDEVMVDGINRFCLRELAASRERRIARWNRDFSSIESYEASITPNRKRLRRIVGAVDLRLTQAKPDRFRFELMSTLDRSSVIAKSDHVTAHAVRWQVLDGVTAEGVVLKPDRVRACAVALPDADWTPEMFCGLAEGVPQQVRLARRLADAGCLVVIPTLINRSDVLSGHPDVDDTNLPHREFIYRQAFEMGRHVIGYEVQKVFAAVDLFEQLGRRESKRQERSFPIGVAGVGEGGLLALYAAALDRRIDSTLVCGYFEQREGLWQEPIYRNVWGLLSEFGDAELAGMIVPRRLVIEACRAVEIKGPPAVRDGRRNIAGPGRIETASLSSVWAEFDEAALIFEQLGKKDKIVLAVSGEKGDGPAGTSKAIAAFVAGLGIEESFIGKPKASAFRAATFGSPLNEQTRDAERQRRQFNELQVHVQNLLRLSPKVRNRKWKADLSSIENWLPVRERLRDHVHDELIGRLLIKRLPLNPRSRLVLETEHYFGYEVVLDVFPDVIAAGILLLPNDLKTGEKRPVVVCQHGLEGRAMDTISREPKSYRFYKAFSDELCRRGFIVYAPQNPYRGRNRFRTIQRKANPLKRSLFSFIIAQHEQTLDWLSKLPNVDAKRIAFYGISYGGKTAMRVPPLVDRYCLSICSADFTDWVRAIATNEDRYGYIFTSEYEIPEWNMGHMASYAELAMLMSPRPFMVEQGHRDGGAPTEWVASEYGKVRRHYDFLKIGDCTEIEFFDGPHTINGKGTYRFLHRHLNWPE